MSKPLIRVSVLAIGATLGFSSVALAVNTFVGTAGNDAIVGSSFDDDITTLGGDDTVHANSGVDTVDGGPGVDRLFGGSGDDVIVGGPDEDFFYGEGGDDTLDDTVGSTPGTGRSHFYGGEGNDHLATRKAPSRMDGGPGDDELQGGTKSDLLVDHSGNDVFVGRGGANVIDATDTLVLGRAGLDRIFGGEGNDTIDTADGGVDEISCWLGQSDAVTMDATLDRFIDHFGNPVATAAAAGCETVRFS